MLPPTPFLGCPAGRQCSRAPRWCPAHLTHLRAPTRRPLPRERGGCTDTKASVPCAPSPLGFPAGSRHTVLRNGAAAPLSSGRTPRCLSFLSLWSPPPSPVSPSPWGAGPLGHPGGLTQSPPPGSPGVCVEATQRGNSAGELPSCDGNVPVCFEENGGQYFGEWATWNLHFCDAQSRGEAREWVRVSWVWPGRPHRGFEEPRGGLPSLSKWR